MEKFEHQPVLLDEVIETLNIKSNGIYIDATFGRGGHAGAILKELDKEGFLLAIDKDPQAIKSISDSMHKDERFAIVHGSFADMQQIAERYQIIHKVNGVLMDLGVSSPQLDDPRRGFSFMQTGPLDMRMDPTTGISAAEWLNKASEQEIAKILYEYGEERFANRIARAIVATRVQEPISTTEQLMQIIIKASPRTERHKHPATRSFQAIRIFINDELEHLKRGLEQALEILAVGGRLCVISFHSLEDRIVKQFIRKYEKGESLPKFLPISQFQPRLKSMTKPIKPCESEIAKNPRARSAIMRVAEKLL